VVGAVGVVRDANAGIAEYLDICRTSWRKASRINFHLHIPPRVN